MSFYNNRVVFLINFPFSLFNILQSFVFKKENIKYLVMVLQILYKFQNGCEDLNDG